MSLKKAAIYALIGLTHILLPLTSFAGIAVDLEEELNNRGENRDAEQMPFQHVRVRVGVFSYEDPDQTGLGNALAHLIARHILLNSRIGSLGVLTFEQRLPPDKQSPLSYFDKVAQVAERQDLSLAVWGVVRFIQHGLQIETYLQLPRHQHYGALSTRFHLPGATGGGLITAEVHPVRILVQRHHIAFSEINAIWHAVAETNTLYAAPNNRQKVVTRLAPDQMYTIQKHSGGWVQISTQGKLGWMARHAPCSSACAPLQEAAGFASAVLRAVEANNYRSLARNDSPALSPQAQRLGEQLLVLHSLAGKRRWSSSLLPSSVPTIISKGGPGNTTGATLKAIADLGAAIAARRHRNQSYENVRLPREALLAAARVLAQASLEDPMNITLLSNIAVLFEAAGDKARAALAKAAVESIAP